MYDRTPYSAPTAASQLERNNYVAMVAHELRDPLMPILNAAAMLLRESSNVEIVQRCAHVIDRQARTMNNLIDDLMNVSRMQTGKLQLTRARVTLSEIVKRCLESASASCEQRGQALKVSISPVPMELHADADRLVQALRNLIVNASKYSPRGAVVEVRACREGDEAIVRVTDSGAGIDAVDIESIFTLFTQRPDDGTSPANAGLGIGLFLARHFAEAHGGSLRAASPGIGLGSTFTLRIPCLSVETHAAEATSARPRRSSQLRVPRVVPDRA